MNKRKKKKLRKRELAMLIGKMSEHSVLACTPNAYYIFNSSEPAQITRCAGRFYADSALCQYIKSSPPVRIDIPSPETVMQIKRR